MLAIGFTIGPAAIAELVAHRVRADRVAHLLKRFGEFDVALGDPQQRSHRVAERDRLDQTTQILPQRWILLSGAAARSRPGGPARQAVPAGRDPSAPARWCCAPGRLPGTPPSRRRVRQTALRRPQTDAVPAHPTGPGLPHTALVLHAHQSCRRIWQSSAKIKIHTGSMAPKCLSRFCVPPYLNAAHARWIRWQASSNSFV